MTEELMDVQTLYHYLVERPDKGTQELYIRGTGVHASTIWHDRYISQMHPRAIAQDRDSRWMPCMKHWRTAKSRCDLPCEGPGAGVVAGAAVLCRAAMRLYLDDDLDGNVLIGLLQHAGHEVVLPRAVGTRGVLDPTHLRYAADHDLVLLTANAKDFLALHTQWQQEGQEHPGMLLVYRENNPQRDMTFQEIARAVSR
jgi:hypothetical protein